MFSRAVEVDEMACGWQKRFEDKLMLIGELFSSKVDEAKPDPQKEYFSMLSEAYLVLLLYTVVDLYDNPANDPQEDYKCDYCPLMFSR